MEERAPPLVDVIAAAIVVVQVVVVLLDGLRRSRILVEEPAVVAADEPLAIGDEHGRAQAVAAQWATVTHHAVHTSRRWPVNASDARGALARLSVRPGTRRCAMRQSRPPVRRYSFFQSSADT